MCRISDRPSWITNVGIRTTSLFCFIDSELKPHFPQNIRSLTPLFRLSSSVLCTRTRVAVQCICTQSFYFYIPHERPRPGGLLHFYQPCYPLTPLVFVSRGSDLHRWWTYLGDVVTVRPDGSNPMVYEYVSLFFTTRLVLFGCKVLSSFACNKLFPLHTQRWTAEEH